MGDQFLPTAAGILGALGDVASVHFCPAVPSCASAGEGGAEAPSAYLLAAESSDISRLRTDVQSLGYQVQVDAGIDSCMNGRGILF